MVSSVPAKPAPDDGVNDTAFAHAVKVFNKARTGVHQLLRLVISEYLFAQRAELIRVRSEQVEFNMADTEAGPNTALVVTGFKNAAEIESFVREFFYASRK